MVLSLITWKATEQQQSQLAGLLLAAAGSGQMSVQAVQRYADAAVNDMEEGATGGLKELAALGARGQWPSNMERDLRRTATRTGKSLNVSLPKLHACLGIKFWA